MIISLKMVFFLLVNASEKFPSILGSVLQWHQVYHSQNSDQGRYLSLVGDSSFHHYSIFWRLYSFSCQVCSYLQVTDSKRGSLGFWDSPNLSFESHSDSPEDEIVCLCLHLTLICLQLSYLPYRLNK